MKPSHISIAMLLAVLFLAPAVLAQSPDSGNQSAASPAPAVSAAEVPRLIKFSGTLLDAQDQPLAGPVGVTFALHAQQSGGAALWLETQNVKPDANGAYTVLLGANSAKGVPAELFASGEARWLGIQVGQQAEHERILLVSVPYALKAGDAETLGGKPASAFALAGSGATMIAGTTGASASPTGGTPLTASAAGPQPAAACSSVTSGGAAPLNAIAKFTGSCSVDGSAITETGGNVGIGTTTPAAALHVNGNTLLVSSATTAQLQFTGSASGARFGQDLNGAFFASDTPGKAVRFYTNNGTLSEGLRITSAGNVGIGTTVPSANLEVKGTTKFGGLASFASGQTFPGTIAGITTAAGSGLTGGGTSGTLNLGLLTSCVSGQLLLWNGTTWVCGNAGGTGTITGVTAGTDLSGGGTSGIVTLNLNTTLTDARYAQLSAANTFTGNQNVSGNLSDTGNISATGSVSGTTASFSGSTTDQVLNVAQHGTGDGIVVVPFPGAGSGISIVAVNPASSGERISVIGGTAPGLSISQSGAGAGINVIAGSGAGIVVGNTPGSTGGGIVVTNGTGSTANGINVTQFGTGVGMFVQSGLSASSGISIVAPFVPATSNGESIKVGSGSSGTGLNISNSGAGSGMFVGTQLGTGDGIDVLTGSGAGIVVSNNPGSTGGGIFVTNLTGSTAKGIVVDSSDQRAIDAMTGSTATAPDAVHGLANADTNFVAGVKGGESGSTQQTVGVIGFSMSSIGIGALGQAIGPATVTTNLFAVPVGVWGDTSGPGTGLLATADAGDAIEGFNQSAVVPTILVDNFTATATGVVLRTLGHSFGGKCEIDVKGNLTCTGTKSAVVPVDGGSRKVALYAVEAAENWFEDAGSGQLSNGSAVVILEPTFAQTVNTGMDYHVFLTPNGDCKGLFVAQKTPTSFIVRELGGGTSNIAFDYRIMARRQAYENIRLADQPDQFQNVSSSATTGSTPLEDPRRMKPYQGKP